MSHRVPPSAFWIGDGILNQARALSNGIIAPILLLASSVPRSKSPSCHALIGKPGVTRAIGHAIDGRIAAETKILMARRIDGPTAALLAEFEQRATMLIVDPFVLDRLLRTGEYRFQDLKLKPRRGSLPLAFGAFS
jgi:hypothetical protein